MSVESELSLQKYLENTENKDVSKASPFNTKTTVLILICLFVVCWFVWNIFIKPSLELYGGKKRWELSALIERCVGKDQYDAFMKIAINILRQTFKFYEFLKKATLGEKNEHDALMDDVLNSLSELKFLKTGYAFLKVLMRSIPKDTLKTIYDTLPPEMPQSDLEPKEENNASLEQMQSNSEEQSTDYFKMIFECGTSGIKFTRLFALHVAPHALSILPPAIIKQLHKFLEEMKNPSKREKRIPSIVIAIMNYVKSFTDEEIALLPSGIVQTSAKKLKDACTGDDKQEKIVKLLEFILTGTVEENTIKTKLIEELDFDEDEAKFYATFISKYLTKVLQQK